MAQYLTQPARAKMRYISGPDGLGLVAADQLAEENFNAAPLLHQPQGPTQLFALFRFVGGQQVQALFSQLFDRLRALVVTVAKQPTLGPSGQVVQGVQIVNIGRCQPDGDDDARPSDPNRSSKAKESLLGQFIITLCGLATKQTMAIGAGRATDGFRKAINYRYLLVELKLGGQRLPKSFFNSSRMGCLTHKGRAIDIGQVGKRGRPMSSELLIERFICIVTQKLADDFRGQDIVITQRGLRSSLPHFLTFQPIIADTKHTGNKRDNIHCGDSCSLFGLLLIQILQWSPFCSTSYFIKPTRGANKLS